MIGHLPLVQEVSRLSAATIVDVLHAQAAIDAVAKLDVGDRTRMAVGGHSYGAFMTANLLAHTNLFHAGIARSSRPTRRRGR